MKKEVHEIAEEIKTLIDRLVSMVEKQPSAKITHKEIKSPKKVEGALGAIMILIEEGFFDTPKNLSSIMEKLQELGRYYPRSTVGMNLLNLTKRRMFSRIKEKKTKNWQYVLRV